MILSLAIMLSMGEVKAHASAESSEFVKQLRSHCESSEYSSADYVLDQSPSSKATLSWKCPYKIALRVDGDAAMEFIFNGSEAWFFYPARSLDTNKPQKLEKVEHYTSLENRVLGLWSDLWREPSRETLEQSKVEELYSLVLKVENRMQIFSFVPKKLEFPSLSLGFALDQSVKIPSTMAFTTRSNIHYSAKMVVGSVKKILNPSQRMFNPELPETKVKLLVPVKPAATE